MSDECLPFEMPPVAGGALNWNFLLGLRRAAIVRIVNPPFAGATPCEVAFRDDIKLAEWECIDRYVRSYIVIRDAALEAKR